jgi:hypothetical protein
MIEIARPLLSGLDQKSRRRAAETDRGAENLLDATAGIATL